MQNKKANFIEKLPYESKKISQKGQYVQASLFDSLSLVTPEQQQDKKVLKFDCYLPKNNDYYHQLQNRRYIGNKQKLINWIFSIIGKECKGKTFLDVFAGTGIVGASARNFFENIILNDFLFSNNAIYEGFLGNGKYNQEKIKNIIKNYNHLIGEELEDNYFSENFGGKYFNQNSAKIIGFIREDIETTKNQLSKKEYYILLSSLLYSADKVANTVGHYDAYFKNKRIKDNFFLKPIEPIRTKTVSIFRKDANLLAKEIKADVVYIDPPYNSRQYSRFYHILENLTQWKKPELHGTALKPSLENMSDYCKISAKDKLEELVNDIKAKYLVCSYNNTYESKSSSSKNKITLEEIERILETKGKTKVFSKSHKHFNAGSTNFGNHKEFLFLTKVKG